MPTSDATPTYRGYRLQALYTLHRVLEATDAARTFQPEKAEDLAVLGADGQLQEIVQVKALTHGLTLSDFNPQKPDSFFYRVHQHLSQAPEARVRIVTYGPVGPELDSAFGGDAAARHRVAVKLSGYNHLSEAEAEALLGRIELVPVQETSLTESVFATLQDLCTGADPRAAFSLMTAWLYDCAENIRNITQQDILGKIEAVGQFIAECAAHTREWFTTILPINETAMGYERAQALGEEYYQGIAARYEHIVADLDVVRDAKQQQLAQAIEGNHVVVVHGASGQGKSTLAYRYLHEYFPEHCRYQVQRIESVTHALSVATALLGHVEAVGVLLAIYLDIAPSDTGWEELVRRLAHHERIRVLITMREEDWRRTTISAAEMSVGQVSLSFDEAEAQDLHAGLVAHRQPVHLLTFTDAWAEFGGAGPLLEFVHLVTQGTTLRARLEQQTQRLKDEVRTQKLTASELTLLRLVSVAGATGARLHAVRLAQHLQLEAPDRTLDLFEQEYLLRVSTDGTYVGPLHPVRSTMLTELLSDTAFSPITQSAVECLALLVEDDLERFLLHMFVHYPDAVEALANSVASWQPERWVALGGVARALLWLGLADYVEENRAVLSDAFAEAGEGALYLLDFDVARLLPGGTNELLEKLESLTSAEWKQRTAALRARQTPTSHAFDRLATYLRGRTVGPQIPSTEGDWIALAEVAYWLGHLQIVWPLSAWLPERILNDAVAALDLETLADVVLGLSSGYGEAFPAWLASQRERLVGRFRAETLTVAFEDDGSKVTAHFVIEADPVRTAPQQIHLRTQDPRNPWHNAALQRIYLMRRLFPDREAYACQGYGHRIMPWELPTDDTRKTGIPRTQLHPHWATALNATFRGLAKRRMRPTTWAVYAQGLLHLRQTISASLTHLAQALETYFVRHHQANVLGDLLAEEAWDRSWQQLRSVPLLPQVAVDAWGFIDEVSASPARENLADNAAMPTRKALALQEYVPLLDAINTYTGGLRNFFFQGKRVMVVNPVLGRQARTSEQRRETLDKAAALGLDPANMPRLSAFNFVNALQALPAFQHEFHQRLAPVVTARELLQIEQEEQRVLARAWACWYMFAFHPERVVQQAGAYGQEQLTSLRTKAKRRLFQALRTVPVPPSANPSVRAQVRSEKAAWNSDPVCWVTLDGALPVDSFSALERTIEAVRRAVLAEREGELQRYLLTLSWHQIAIVPLARGKSLNGSAWRIPTAVFLNTEGVGGINAWNLIQQEIPSTVLAQLGLSRWELPGMEQSMALLGAVSSLSFLAVHVRDLTQVPELDSRGRDDMQQYLVRLERHISDALQSVLNAETELVKVLSPFITADQERNAYLAEASRLLLALHEAVLPVANFQGQHTLTLETISAWAARLEQARTQCSLIYLALASAAIEERGDGIVNKDESFGTGGSNTRRRRRKRRKR